jgi:hypothetical protein
MAVNNWGQLGKWLLHVCRNPLLLDKELAFLTRSVEVALNRQNRDYLHASE